MTIGARAGVTVTTTSAPRTVSSRSVDGMMAKPLYFGCCASVKALSVARLRLQTRTSDQGTTSLQVASTPSAIWPAPTIANVLAFLRAIHLAETAAAAPVRITV